MEQVEQFIINHWPLCLAFFVILGLILISEILSQKKKAAEISPQAAVDLMNHEEAVVVDLREKEAYKASHILDAIWASEEDFSQTKMHKYKDKKLILVCARGLQSQTTAAKLRTQGYQPLVLAGGMTAWKDAELPLVKGK